MKRLVVGILLLTLALGGGIARAQYPPSTGNGRVTRSELKQCQCTQFSGDGFAPGTLVTVVDRGPGGVEQVVGTVTADAKGEFKIKVCFDEQALQGDHTLVGRGVEPGGGAREVSAAVHVDGSVCFKKGDEVHGATAVGGGAGGEVGSEQPRDGSSGPGSTGSGSGSGSAGSGSDGGVGGVNLPRTGADYVLPGLLFGFLLVVTGTGLVHLTRRRRLVTS